MGIRDTKAYKEAQGLVETGATLLSGAGSQLVGNIKGAYSDISQMDEINERKAKMQKYSNWLNQNQDKKDTEDYQIVMQGYNELKSKPIKSGEEIASEFAQKYTYEPYTEEGKRNLEAIGEFVDVTKLAGIGPEFQTIPKTLPIKTKPKFTIQKAKTREDLPTSETLISRANQLFTQADEANIAFNPNAGVKMADAIDNALRENKISSISKTGIAAKNIANKIRQRSQKGETISMSDYMEYRDLFDDLVDTTKPKTGRVAGIGQKALDDFVDAADETMLAAGDEVSIQTFNQARKKWGQAKKTADVENMMAKAERKVGANYTDAQLADAVRKEFNSLLNSPKRRKFYTKQELNVMDDFVKNDSKTLKALSKLDASTGSPLLALSNLGTSSAIGLLSGSPEIGAATFLAQTFGGKTAKALREAKSRQQLMKILSEIQGGGGKGERIVTTGLDLKQVPTSLLMLPPVTSQNQTVEDIIKGSLL